MARGFLWGLAALLGSSGVAMANPGSPSAEGEPPVTCVADHEAPGKAVTKTFAQLRAIYQTRLPGPRGAEIQQDRIDALIDRAVDVGRFTRRVTPDLWNEATEARRIEWKHALELMLRNRYLKLLTSPTNHRLVVRESAVSCDTAAVVAVLTPRENGNELALSMELSFDDGEWRLFNVTVDGVDLAHTWRRRFWKVYLDGGIPAVDRQMAILAHRYRGD